MSDPSQLRNIFLPAVLILVVAFLILLFPPFAVVLGVVAPVPIIFLSLQWGRGPGLVLMALIFVVLFGLMGAGQAITFFVEYAVLALIMAETIRLRLEFDQCILFSAVGSAILTTFLLFVLVGNSETSLTDFFQQQIEGHFQESLESLKSMGESPADLQAMKQFAEGSARTLASAYPAFILVGSLIAAAVNYALVRLLWVRLYGKDLFSGGKFSEWIFPDYPVWLLILSGLALFALDGVVGTIGMNVFAVMVVLYFFHGLAITVHFLESRNVPVFFWVVVFFLIFIQPILMGLVAGLGVFDLWVDFRKLRKTDQGQNS